MCFKTLETTHTIRELLYSCSESDNTSNLGEGFVVVVVVVVVLLLLLLVVVVVAVAVFLTKVKIT